MIGAKEINLEKVAPRSGRCETERGLILVVLCGNLDFERPVSCLGREKTGAVIGGEEIKKNDLDDEIASYGKNGDFHARLLTLMSPGKKDILDNLVKERLFYRAAVDKHVKLDLESEKRRQRVRQDIVVKKYIRTILEQQAATDRELYDYYLKHKAEFVVPEKRKVRHIVVTTKEAAEGILKCLENGGDFKVLAKPHNIDGTKQKEGGLGWVTRGVMAKDFEDVAFSLPEHQVSQVVKTGFGYHLIRVEEIKKPAREPIVMQRKR